MLKKNRMASALIAYCAVLMLAAAAFAVTGADKRQTVVSPETTDIPVTQPVQVADITATPIPTIEPTKPIPTPVIIEGPENWKQFATEIDFDWGEIKDKPCILIRKPAAATHEKVTANILTEAGEQLELILKNCTYTEVYYSSIERRANGHYYNAQPPILSTEEGLGTADEQTQTSVADKLSDPLRKLSSMLIKEKNGSYTITVRLTLDSEYQYTLFETKSFYAISLVKGQ